MADPVVRLHCGDEYFDLAGLMSAEMANVKSWTGCKNRREFIAALQEEDPEAVQAAFTLARRRNGNPDVKFRDVDVCLDDLEWSRHIDGRTVKLSVEEDEDGQPLLVVVDAAGKPIPDGDGWKMPTGDEDEKTGLVVHYTDDGRPRWRYVDTGEDVDPTQPEPTTSGSTGSPSTAKTRRGSASGSGTPTTSDT